MAKIKSEGKCIFCNGMFPKSSISRHMQKHLTEKSIQNKPGKSFLLKVETNPKYGGTPYFLSLWVNGETSMEIIDDFLRQIWLECCGHMSSFTNQAKRQENTGMWGFFEAEELLEKGKIKEYEKLKEDFYGEVPLSRKAKLALFEELKLLYRYDFGSTTELQITVMSEYSIKADKSIVLLSRNEPPELLCENCDKEVAIQLCTTCYGYTDIGLFCEKCAGKHAETCKDFADYAATSVVNSPRMGVCGYEGGVIDTERDGKAQK